MMKTITYITLSMVLLGMLLGGIRPAVGQDTPLFYETYTANEVLSAFDQSDPLYSYLKDADPNSEGSRLGSCESGQMDELLKYVQSSPVQRKLPSGIKLTWGRPGPEGNCFLYALRNPDMDRGPGNGDIVSVQVKKAAKSSSFDLFLRFNEQGTERWAKMTRENVGRDIAMVVGGEVISAPRVQDEIKLGKCLISGDLSKSEVDEIKRLLGH